jgi:2-isopropylmalate synthase
MKRVEIYDTTLRDGTQGEGVSFSSADKIKIAQCLDKFGVKYIEGGWPGSNPKDMDFFKQIRNIPLRTAKIAAFGSTRKGNVNVEDDFNIKALIDSKTQVVTIFGKSWDFHVKDALKVPLEENLNMIYDSIAYLKSQGKFVIYDAEHYFDGFRANKDYALKTVEMAKNAGAEVIVLCDTNGGTITSEITSIIKVTMSLIKANYGIHTHNDSGLAVANSITAVELGCTHVQGTINGFGERCGNANLCSIIPIIQLKLGIKCVSDKNLKMLSDVSYFVSEVANVIPTKNDPFVGDSAFAHKAGIHVDAMMKNIKTYEHISPELVGNKRRVLLSDLSGKSNIKFKTTEMELKDVEPSHLKEIADEIKNLEYQGYLYEDAEGSFELLVRKKQGKLEEFFELEGFRVIIEKRPNKEPYSEATIKLRVKGVTEHTAAEGDGPVNALDNALRKALEKFYPNLKKMQLTDYKVRVLEGKEGTKAKVRVLIESANRHQTWGTVGVSENIIQASWEALVDSINYHLLKDKESKKVNNDENA